MGYKMRIFKILSLVFFIMLFSVLFYSCSDEKQCISLINKYISYSKAGRFDKIYENLLTGPAQQSFSRFAKELASAQNSEQYNIVIDTFKKIKRIKILAVEKFNDTEIAIKFQMIRKDEVIEDTPWWRFKKVDGKMKIMKFSKH